MSIETNKISKSAEIFENFANMGIVDLKNVDSTANVINKVEVQNTDCNNNTNNNNICNNSDAFIVQIVQVSQ